jgi:hypothetical protein
MNEIGRFFTVLIHDLWVALWCFMAVCATGMAVRITHDFAKGLIPWPLP